MMGRAASRGRRPLDLLLVGSVALLVAGCAHLMRGPDPATDSIFPLTEGRTWVFRVDAGDGESVDVITRVVSIEDNRVEMTSGTTRYVYEIREDGLYRPSLDAYLIRMPLETGASWPGPHGGTVTVLSVDESVTVPAGTFERCVRIEEATPHGEQRQIHTFCPGVGPVRLEQYLQDMSHAVGTLTSFGTETDDAS
jgi:hypothetical protein